MELSERIQTIIKVNNHTASSFAEVIGVQRSSLSHILNGRNKPSMDFIQKVIEHFPRVDAQWLITGKQSGGVAATLQDLAPESNDPKPDNKSDLGDALNGNKKVVERIIVFYTDRTFDTYEQS